VTRFAEPATPEDLETEEPAAAEQTETQAPSGPDTETDEDASPAQPEPPGDEAPASETEAAAAPKDAATVDPDEAFWQRVSALDPEELARRNRQLANKVGNDARRLAERWQREQQEKTRDQQLAEAYQRGDTEAIARLVSPDIQRRQQQLTQEAALNPGGYAYQAVADFHATLPEPVQQALTTRTYDQPSNKERFVAYLADVAEQMAEHRFKERMEATRKAWEKEVLPALQKRALAEVRGGEPAPDLDGGAAAGRRVVYDSDLPELSDEEYDALFDGRGEPKPGVVYRPGQRPKSQAR
jgi:hypothetical protein